MCQASNHRLRYGWKLTVCWNACATGWGKSRKGTGNRSSSPGRMPMAFDFSIPPKNECLPLRRPGLVNPDGSNNGAEMIRS